MTGARSVAGFRDRAGRPRGERAGEDPGKDLRTADPAADRDRAGLPAGLHASRDLRAAAGTARHRQVGAQPRLGSLAGSPRGSGGQPMTPRLDRFGASQVRVFGPATEPRARRAAGTPSKTPRIRRQRWNRDAASLGWAAVVPARSGVPIEGVAKSPPGWNASPVLDEWSGSSSLAETRGESRRTTGNRAEPDEVAVAFSRVRKFGVGRRGHERLDGFG